MKFYTKYDKVPRSDRILSREDNVDRLSYVDSSLLIKRMILSGENLLLNRAKALQAGLYDENAVERGEDFPVVSPYAEDPVVLQRKIDDIKRKSDRLSQSVSSKSARPSQTSPDLSEPSQSVERGAQISNGSESVGSSGASETKN